MFKSRQSHYLHLDLILFLLFFIVISLLAINNAQQLGQYNDNFVVKHLVFYMLGIMLAAAIQFVDLVQLYKTSFYLYILGVLSLVILHFSPESIAKPVNGAKSWLNNLPFISIQPSEFTKLFLILFLAYLIYRHQQKYAQQTIASDLWLIAKIFAVTLIPAFFIWKQPDLGTPLVFFFIAGILIILSGVDWRLIAVILTTGIAADTAAVLLIVNFPDFAQNVLKIEPHQINRVLTWFDPSSQDSNDRYHL